VPLSPQPYCKRVDTFDWRALATPRGCNLGPQLLVKTKFRMIGAAYEPAIACTGIAQLQVVRAGGNLASRT
jgi:hypothetical protein